MASLAAHLGISRTDLLPNGAGAGSMAGLARRYLWFLFQPAAQGTLPTLFAVTTRRPAMAATTDPTAWVGRAVIRRTPSYRHEPWTVPQRHACRTCPSV